MWSKGEQNVQSLEGVLLTGDQDSSSIRETVVKLETIWPIYLLMEKQWSPGQLELCLPTFWMSEKLRLMAKCSWKLGIATLRFISLTPFVTDSVAFEYRGL